MSTTPPTEEVMAAGPWRNNAELIVDAHRLGYLPDPVLDTTVGRGRFWTMHRPAGLVSMDLHAGQVVQGHRIHGRVRADATALPFPADRFGAVVLDPPYKLNGTSHGTGPATSDVAYGVHRRADRAGRHGLLGAMLTEAARVVRPGGFVLVKVQAQVEGGRVRWQTVATALAGERLGLQWRDELLLRGYRKQPPGRGQDHARRNYSSLVVLQAVGVGRVRSVLDLVDELLPPG